MNAWMGGRRKLIKEQKARKRLEGVFNKATKRKPPPTGPQDLDALVTRFQKLAPAPKAHASPSDSAPTPSFSRSLGPSLDILAISGPAQKVAPTAHSPALNRPHAQHQFMEEEYEEPQTPRVLKSSSGKSAAAEEELPAAHLAPPQAAQSSEQ